ncbi:hypothetical protein B0A54_04178 [Friedmanniomyces endolithicus]|uniref:Uncharacterized protein n=1 Tax=Friedmanniomyces endolithicus TaxID=329885 RepID=A0A4V5N901_9PEZI|nr:hypothetical protein B0A54_04178 [Friedmanniomyces endolithicus]
MNVGPLPLAQPGSRGAFGFDPHAAYPYVYQQPVTAQSPAFSTHTRTSQAYLPGSQSGLVSRALANCASQVYLTFCLHGPAHAVNLSFRANGGTTSSISLPLRLPWPSNRLPLSAFSRLTSEDAAAQPHPYYTTAPYSQSVPAQVPTGPQPQLVRHTTASASPQPRPSPHAVSSSQQTPPNNNTKFPMAAPPLPRSPANQQAAAASSQQGSASPSTHPTPQSPGSHSREQQRVALLLDINTDMLHEVNRLQAEGKGGATTPQIQAQMKAAGQPADLASEEYTQVLRRVQANLGYLMPVAQNDAQKTPRGPAYMSPPAHMPQLQPKFDQLRELFPDWQGFEPRASQSAMSPGLPHGGGGVNGTTPVQA